MHYITTNIISELRALRPDRHLVIDEARVVAERQAARLLERLDVNFPVRIELGEVMPRLRVVRDRELPEHVAGSSHWNGTHWVISINSGNPQRRQRFTVFHELHHVLEHPFRRFDGEAIAEVVADHFAACVLMPKAEVKSAWFAGQQNVDELADLFEVSIQAMRVRLVKLGLVDGSGHSCRRTAPEPFDWQSRRRPRRYFRTGRPVGELEVAA